MKCEENGGCPFLKIRRGEEYQCFDTPGYVKRCNDELRYKRCKLDSTSFPVIKAMIAGEFNCPTCGYAEWDSDRNQWWCGADLVSVPNDFFCASWCDRKESGHE
jgi:hypothetical protein